MKSSRFAFLALAFVIMAQEILCQNEECRIQGRVSTLWGIPIEGIELRFYKLEDSQGLPASEKLIQQTTTDTHGRYKVAALPWGHYRIEAGQRGEAEVWRFYLWRGANRVLDMGIPLGMKHHLAEISVTGQVQQANNSPIEGATVTIMNAYNSSEVQQGITDKAGVFKLELIQPGQYVIYVAMPGFRLKATTVDLGNGSKERVNFNLSRGQPKFIKQ